jgi:hypothetical protein
MAGIQTGKENDKIAFVTGRVFLKIVRKGTNISAQIISLRYAVKTSC